MLVAWLFSSTIVFYAVGLVTTAAVSIIGTFYYLTEETQLERKEPPNIV